MHATMASTSNDNEKNNNRKEDPGTFVDSLRTKFFPSTSAFTQHRINVLHHKEESEYRQQFTAILRQHPNLFSSSSSSSSSNATEYASERALLQSAMRAERTSIVSGISSFFLSFVALRYGPTVFITKFATEARAKAFRESERVFRENNNNALGRMALFVVGCIQASMAGWVGVRTYRNVSSSQEDSYTHIANIPLVPGRSVLSDALCSSWIDTFHRIPGEFWQRKDKEDERAWKAIRSFAINCQRRGEYEKQVREREQTDIVDVQQHVCLPLPVDQADLQDFPR